MFDNSMANKDYMTTTQSTSCSLSLPLLGLITSTISLGFNITNPLLINHLLDPQKSIALLHASTLPHPFSHAK